MKKLVLFYFFFIFSIYSNSYLGKFKVTFYYVIPEKNYAIGLKNTPIKNLDGEIISFVTKKYKELLDIEGTGLLIDGRVVNFSGIVNHEIRYFVAIDSPYGYGINSCKLNPFYSIAADPKVIKLGSKIYIKNVEGLVLPDGNIHNGIFDVVDIGGAIKDKHIDIFVGMDDNSVIFEKVNVISNRYSDLYLVRQPEETSCVFDEEHAPIRHKI